MVIRKSGTSIIEDCVILSKHAAAKAAVKMVMQDSVTDDVVIGLGSGSTAEIFVRELASGLCRMKRKIAAVVPSSNATGMLASSLGMKVKRPITVDACAEKIGIYVDGADQVDPALNLIKGRGGALFREKIVARIAKRFIVIVDEGKLVKRLGPIVPVEVAKEEVESVIKGVEALGGRGVLRRRMMNVKNGNGSGPPFVTDNGNFILDCDFGKKTIDAALASRLMEIAGVVDTGFFGRELVSAVIVGMPDGSVKILERVVD